MKTTKTLVRWVTLALIVLATLIAPANAGAQSGKTPASGTTGTYEFTGPITEVGPNSLVVRGMTVVIDGTTKFLGEQTKVGSLADIQAELRNGRLVATIVFGRSEEPVTLAGAQSSTTPASGVKFAGTTSDWATPVRIFDGMAVRPSLAFTADGMLHAAFVSGGAILASHRNLAGSWSESELVAIGDEPHMIAGVDDTLHLAFVNSFMGNFETYSVVRRNGNWSLPFNMSHTSGYSARPKLALGPDGMLHAAWMDFTPGYWTIYHAALQAGAGSWSSRAIPSGRGESPSIVVARDGTVSVAWHDAGEVWLSTLPQGGNWQPPLDISDDQGQSALPSLVATLDDKVNVVWTQSDAVRYAKGQGLSWTWPVTVTLGSEPAGAQIVIDGSSLFLAWTEAGSIRHTNSDPWGWAPPGMIFTLGAGMRDVAVAASPLGGVCLAWTLETSTSTQVWVSCRGGEPPPTPKKTYLPLVQK